MYQLTINTLDTGHLVILAISSQRAGISGLTAAAGVEGRLV